MAAQEQSIQNESRHSVYVQRYAGWLANQFDDFADELRKTVNAELAEAGTELQGRRLNRFLSDLAEQQADIYNEYEELITSQLNLFSDSEATWELNSLDDVIEADVDLTRLPPEQVWAAVLSQPMVFPDSNDVVQMEPFIRGFSDREIQRTNSIIRTGFATGRTTNQIARDITQSIDGVTTRNAKTMARTATSHTSAYARESTLLDNDDIVIGYEWVSTLDSRTSQQCKSLDGEIFKWSDRYKPKPPIHPNCRSTTAPVLDQRYRLDDSDALRASRGSEGGQPVSADQNYYSWLKTQPDDFVMDTLGPTRGKLFLDGGLTSDEFAKLNVDQLFRPLTLQEMQEKNPLAFERAGIG